MERDNKIMEFIEMCPADSNTICKLFFTGKRTCNERLKTLNDYGYMKRWRPNVNENYIYYIKRKPKQIEHCNYISKSYLWIIEQGYKIEKFKREITIENVRADALCKIKNNNKDGYLIVEVELSNNNINRKLEKYEEICLNRTYKKYFDAMPKLLYFSNQKIKSDIINVISKSIKELP